MRYQKLPKNTPRWLTVCIFLLGGALGFSISISTLLGLYGVYGFLANFFFPGSLAISPAEGMFLGCLGVVAIITAVMVSFLAFFMNVLSRKAIELSKIVWIPLIFTMALVAWQWATPGLQYHLSRWWLIGTAFSLIFGGILPALLLGNKAAQKLHSK